MIAAIGITAVIQDPAASEALRRAQEAAEAAERARAAREGNGNG
ncbi:MULTISPECIES: hypothetical protein [unclassified Streptomyces]|nr:hypothetical protein [Streptomyces sp. NBC_01717]